MMQQSPQTPAENLQELLSRLDSDYYAPVLLLCEKIAVYIAELHGGDVHQTASLYTSLSKKLLGQVEQYVRLRRFGLMPYIQELMEKKSTGHDCRSCSSSCTVRHSAQLTGIREAHTKIKETLYRLQSVALPIYYQSLHHEAYLALRNGIMHLDTTLTALFYLEESSLMPKVMDAQKNIHAGS